MPVISGPAGGVTPVGIVLGLSAQLDYAPVATRDIAWDQAFDNTADFNPITQVPAGLGMTLPINGLSADFTTTISGVWWFSLSLGDLSPDATLVIAYGQSSAGLGNIAVFNGGSGGFTPTVPYGEAVYLPSGTTSSFSINTRVAATAATFLAAPTATIVRLA